MSYTLGVKPTHVLINTDGSCLGNPGPGGYAAIIRWMVGDVELRATTVKGRREHTTNIAMEMQAAIAALSQLRADDDDLPVIVRSDNSMLVKGATEWMPNWIKHNWRKADGKPVANVELWRAINAQMNTREVSFEWVKGHSGDTQNDEVDALASSEARDAQAVLAARQRAA